MIMTNKVGLRSLVLRNFGTATPDKMARNTTYSGKKGRKKCARKSVSGNPGKNPPIGITDHADRLTETSRAENMKPARNQR